MNVREALIQQAPSLALQRAAADEIARLDRDKGALQAQIDRLMLEFCPDEMTAEQKAEWARHQVVHRV